MSLDEISEIVGSDPLRALIESENAECAEYLAKTIPHRMHFGIAAYLLLGLQPGDFLYSVFSNNLEQAAALADDENRLILYQYVVLVHNHLPGNAHGGTDQVMSWTSKGGLLGRQNARAGW